MALITDIRKNVTDSTPLMAAVGATDYAVERVRAAAANAAHLQDEVGKTLQQWEGVPAAVQARLKKIDAKAVQQVPTLALARAREAADRAEQSYEKLAVRGKALVQRVRSQKATQDFIQQGKITLSRTRAAVTSARKAVDETATAARAVVTIGRRDAGKVTEGVEAEVAESVAATEKVVEERTRATRAAAGGVATTVRKQAVSTRTAAHGAATSARKTAQKAVVAAEEAAEQVGREAPAAAEAIPAPQAPAAPEAPAAE